MKNKLIILALYLFIYSCSQTPKQPTHEEYFVTHILSDGTKMFSYNIISDRSKGSRKQGKKGGKGQRGGNGNRGNAGSQRGQSNRGGDKEKMKSRLNRKLKNILLENNYCRDGFIELNSSFGRGSSEMKGQCNDKANENDYIKFKNQ